MNGLIGAVESAQQRLNSAIATYIPRMSRAPYHAAACMGSPLTRGPWIGTLTFSSLLAKDVAIVLGGVSLNEEGLIE